MTAVPVSIGARRDAPESSDAMPADGPLVDRHGRVHTDVRLSVTDRCNFRCAHCLPDDDVAFTPRAEVLSFAELARVAGVLRDLGITTVRVTGGAPPTSSPPASTASTSAVTRFSPSGSPASAGAATCATRSPAWTPPRRQASAL